MTLLYSKHKIDSKPVQVRLLRQYLRKFCQVAELSTQETEYVVIAFNEAASNVIEHAYDNDHDSPIIVEFMVEEVEQSLALTSDFASGVAGGEESLPVENAIVLQKRAVIKIRDFGKKVPRRQIASKPLDHFQKHGLGVYLIEKCTDALFYDTDVDRGTLLTMVKLLS